MDEIRTTLATCDLDGLNAALQGMDPGEIVSLGMTGEGFVIVSPADGRSIRAVEKKTKVLPPRELQDVPILLEGVQKVGGVTVVVSTKSFNINGILEGRLIDCVLTRLDERHSHLVLATWRPPSSRIYIRLAPTRDFEELFSYEGRPRFSPRLVALEGGTVGLLVMCGRELQLIRLNGRFGYPAFLYEFSEDVLEVSRLRRRRSDSKWEFIVTTESGIEWFIFDPTGTRTASMQRVKGVGFSCLGALNSGGRRPLFVAHDDEGTLVVGPPGRDFISASFVHLTL